MSASSEVVDGLGVQGLGCGGESRGWLQALVDRLSKCETLVRHWVGAALPTRAPDRVVDVTGVVEGMQVGDRNAPNSMWAILVENFTGMVLSPAFQRARTQAAVGADSVDAVRANPLYPRVGRFVTLLGEDDSYWCVDLDYTRTVPRQEIWEKYVGHRMEFWGRVLESDSDVYHQAHVDYAYFHAMANVVILRYRLLLALAQVLIVEHHLEWGVAWRVICTQVSRGFARHLLHHKSPTDCDLFSVLSAPLACRADRILAVARGRAEIMGHTVAEAQADADAFAGAEA
jgi:hypothetical protein